MPILFYFKRLSFSQILLTFLLLFFVNGIQVAQTNQTYRHIQNGKGEILQRKSISFYQEQSEVEDLQSQNSQIDQQGIKNQGQQGHQQSHYHSYHDGQFWINFAFSIFLLSIGAFCSGMSVGYCSVDKLQLEVMSMSKDQKQKKIAITILQVVSNHHLWMVTVLVYNAIALQSLPLVVHTLMPDWAAIIFSTLFVLIAAQIIPQAVCTGPLKMTLAYRAAPVITIMRKLMFFIIYPIAKALDHLLGQHNHQRIQHKDFANFLTGNQILKKTEKILLTSTLELRCQRVQEKMISIKKLYMIQCSEIINAQKIVQIVKKDYSYIFVYRQKRDQIVGRIKVKQFAFKYLKGFGKPRKAEQMTDCKAPFLCVYRDTNLLEMLMLFQSNSRRIALICDEKKKTAQNIPSIMYTKNDMIMHKKQANIIGAIFLYQIFDELTDIQQNVPKQLPQIKIVQQQQMKEMKQKNEQEEPFLNKAQKQRNKY